MISNHTKYHCPAEIYTIEGSKKKKSSEMLILHQITSILAIVFAFPFANWKNGTKYKTYEETYYDSTIICKFLVTYHAKVPGFRIYKHWIDFYDQKDQYFW